MREYWLELQSISLRGSTWQGLWTYPNPYNLLRSVLNWLSVLTDFNFKLFISQSFELFWWYSKIYKNNVWLNRYMWVTHIYSYIGLLLIAKCVWMFIDMIEHEKKSLGMYETRSVLIEFFKILRSQVSPMSLWREFHI